MRVCCTEENAFRNAVAPKHGKGSKHGWGDTPLPDGNHLGELVSIGHKSIA